MRKLIYSIILLLLGFNLFGKTKNLYYFTSCPSLKDEKIEKHYYSFEFNEDGIITSINSMNCSNDNYLNLNRNSANNSIYSAEYDYSEINKSVTKQNFLFQVQYSNSKDEIVITSINKKYFSFKYSDIDNKIKELQSLYKLEYENYMYTDNFKLKFEDTTKQNSFSFNAYKVKENIYEVFDISQGVIDYNFKNLIATNYEMNSFSEKASKINSVIYYYIANQNFEDILPFISNSEKNNSQTYFNQNYNIVCNADSVQIKDKVIKFDKIYEKDGGVILIQNNENVAGIVQNGDYLVLYVPGEKTPYYGSKNKDEMKIINIIKYDSNDLTFINNSYKKVIFLNGSINFNTINSKQKPDYIEVTDENNNKEYLYTQKFNVLITIDTSKLTGKRITIKPKGDFDSDYLFTKLLLGIK